MKMAIIALTTSVLVAASSFAASAQHHHGEGNHHQNENNHEQFKVNDKFQKQLMTVYENYINLKNAFVASDSEAAGENVQPVKNQLKKVDQSLLEGKALKSWKQYKETMNQGLKNIQASNDLAEQRSAFSTVSDALYQSMKAFGIKEMDAYYQYCPMAMDGDGAHWLSMNKEIRNPYFGSQMMHCGKTKKELN
jgi:Cu(I)/Ag(I) efflux system membrane fusion protein